MWEKTGGGRFHWRMHYYGLWTYGQKWQFWVKDVLIMNLFLTNTQLLSSQDVNWWSGVDYCDVFIRLSFWRHPFTAERSLLRQWCNATFLQIWWRNKLIYSTSLMTTYIFIFGCHLIESLFIILQCYRK